MAKQMGDDDRFAQLIHDEYGEDVAVPATAEDAIHRKQRRRAKRNNQPKAEWFSLDKAIDEAEPDYEPWERFTAPTPPSLQRPRNPLVIVGLLAILTAVVIGVLWIVGVMVPIWVRGIGGALIGIGLLAALLAIPKRHQDIGDGAVL